MAKSAISHGENKYIRNQMKGLPTSFINAVLRLFEMIKIEQIDDGCLPCSVMLCIAAQYCGIDIEFCYGQCKVNNRSFYHAWTQYNNKIIDVAIYGNIKYSGFFPECNISMPVIYLTENEESSICYSKGALDADWKYAAINFAEGMSMAEYLDGVGTDILWRRICMILNIPQTKSNFEILRKIANDKNIENPFE